VSWSDSLRFDFLLFPPWCNPAPYLLTSYLLSRVLHPPLPLSIDPTRALSFLHLYPQQRSFSLHVSWSDSPRFDFLLFPPRCQPAPYFLTFYLLFRVLHPPPPLSTDSTRALSSPYVLPLTQLVSMPTVSPTSPFPCSTVSSPLGCSYLHIPTRTSVSHPPTAWHSTMA
jgi:hypothetical protein